MLKKVPIDRDELNRFIRFKKFNQAKDFIAHVRDVIELVAMNRVDVLLNNDVILKTEKETFIRIIRENIVSKLLEDKDYILVDESYVLSMEEKVNKFKEIKKKRVSMRKRAIKM